MSQGLHKNYIFNDAQDIKYYVKTMYQLLNDYSLKIISYCIMNNHAHILIKSEKLLELSNYMQRTNLRYAMYYNKKYHKVGYVFRNRFKSEPILNKKHLYNCMKYIYDNPVKAQICSKPEDYPYSNYRDLTKYNKYFSNEYLFIDTAETKKNSYYNFIEDFLSNHNTDINNIATNPVYLKELICILKEKYQLSLRKIAEILTINREKIRKLYKTK